MKRGKKKGRLAFYPRAMANRPPMFGLRRPVDWVYWSERRRLRGSGDRVNYFRMLELLESQYGEINA